jgi:hypothetical protein
MVLAAERGRVALSIIDLRVLIRPLLRVIVGSRSRTRHARTRRSDDATRPP